MIDPIIQFANRTKETTSTTGTGNTITLTGAITGFKAFPTTDGAIYLFEVLNTNGTWQIYRGAWSTGGTIDRTSGPVDSWDGSGTNFSILAGAEVLCVADAAWFADSATGLTGYLNLGNIGGLIHDLRTDRISVQTFTTDATPTVLYSLAEGTFIDAKILSGYLIARHYGGSIGPPGDIAIWSLSGYVIITDTTSTNHRSRVDLTSIHADSGLSGITAADSSSSGVMEITITGTVNRTIQWLLIGHLSSLAQV